MTRSKDYERCQVCGGVLDERGPNICPTGGHCQKQLHESAPTEVSAPLSGPGSDQEKIDWLEQRIKNLERELAGSEDKYAKLNDVYNKLADQWNAFQATTRPDNRNIHRAEAAGELARKLAEVLIGLAYDKDALDSLLMVMAHLANGQSEGRQAAEVAGRLNVRAVTHRVTF